MLKGKIFLHLLKKFFVVSAIVVVAFLLISLVVMRFYANDSQNQSETTPKNNVASTPPVTENGENNSDSFDNTGNPNQIISENFRLENINFGGDAFLPNDQDETMPIEISDMKNESFLSKKGDESKVVISWKSNKLTMASITYSKNDGQNAKTISEGSFGFSHSLVISGLEPGTGYMYKIRSMDRWSNRSETEFFGFYSGEKTQSIIELINKEFNSIFNWATK